MQKIRILIGKDGLATVSVDGVQGPGCLEMTKIIEAALGQVQERQLCDAYHLEVSEQATEQVNQSI
jgi:hypothetical protein